MSNEPMTPMELLERALANEKNSYEFYHRMAEHTKIEIIRELIEGLRDEEAQHVKKIEEKLAKLRLGQMG